MTSAQETTFLSFEAGQQFAEQALIKAGAGAAQAKLVAESMIMAEMNGAVTHGLFRLGGYCASLNSGKIKGKAEPIISEIAPTILKVDGQDGFAPYAHQLALPRLGMMAKQMGMAAASFCNIHHFSSLWQETEKLAEMGLVALACTAYLPVMVHPPGKKPIYGTNPISFAWPRQDQAPMVIDFATSVVARGEVMLAAREGRSVDLTVGVDSDGKPTTDPNQVLKGAMLPFGGYKGAGLALMVELLAASLLGQPTSLEAGRKDNKDGGPASSGEFILALNPNLFGAGANWQQSAENLFAEILDDQGTRLPGDGRKLKREKIMAKGGFTIPSALYRKIISG